MYIPFLYSKMIWRYKSDLYFYPLEIVWIYAFKKHSEFKLLKQMLDGHENALEVSASLPVNSPSKQKTLDQFVRRCDNTDGLEYEPNPKRPRS